MDTNTTTPFQPSRRPHATNWHGYNIVTEKHTDYFAALRDEWLIDDEEEMERRRTIMHLHYTYPYADAVITTANWRTDDEGKVDSAIIRADVMLDVPDYGDGPFRNVVPISVETKRDNMPFGAITTFGMATMDHNIDKATRLANIISAVAEWAESELYFSDEP